MDNRNNQGECSVKVSGTGQLHVLRLSTAQLQKVLKRQSVPNMTVLDEV